jgi:hypothetical protein
MAGPWEQYQTPQAVPDAAPWMAYQGQGEHGYAPAPPEAPSNTTQEGAIAEGYPEASVAAYFDKNPITIPVPAAVTDLAAYREPGTDNTDIEPREGAATRIVGAAAEGFKTGMAGRTGPDGRPDPAVLAAQEQFNRGSPLNTWIVTPGMRLAGGVMGAAGGAFGQGAYEVGNLWSPEAGRDAYMGAQVVGSLWPLRAKIPSPADLAAAPRVSPMMEGFDRAEAMRAEQPSRPQPPDPAASGIARTQAQIGLRDAPPPSPDMTATPAERAPGFVPRVNIDPLTDKVTTTQVPNDLRLRAAIEAVPPEAPPGFVPPGERGPSVPPGAAGPATIPPYAPGTRAAPLMEGFNRAEPAPETVAAGGWRPVRPDEVFQPGQQFRMNQSTGVSEVYEPPGAQSVGAAASREGTADTAFGRTAREIKGQRADMELADLMRTPQPGDARDIIPGATQTKAEIELHPDVSREAKGLRQEFREGFNEHEKANNEIYHQHIDDVVPPREQIGTMKDVREARWKTAEKTVFGPNPNGEPVSTAPIINHMKAVLADPVEKSNSYLRKAFQPFLDALTDENGNPIQLGAKEVYGQRAEMARKVKDMSTDTDLAHVRGQFGDLIDTTDKTITGGAPEYRTMMDNYRNDSIPINEKERLADIRLKITNGSDRVITFGAFDRYMKSLWMERHGPNPYAPAKDISQATWDHLMMLHERLARSASADELAKTKGSDTTQLMMDMVKKGALGAAHIAAAKLTGGLGNIAIPYITKQFETNRAQKKVGQHLNPDLTKYPPVVP